MIRNKKGIYVRVNAPYLIKWLGIKYHLGMHEVGAR